MRFKTQGSFTGFFSWQRLTCGGRGTCGTNDINEPSVSLGVPVSHTSESSCIVLEPWSWRWTAAVFNGSYACGWQVEMSNWKVYLFGCPSATCIEFVAYTDCHSTVFLQLEKNCTNRKWYNMCTRYQLNSNFLKSLTGIKVYFEREKMFSHRLKRYLFSEVFLELSRHHPQFVFNFLQLWAAPPFPLCRALWGTRLKLF